MVGTSGLVGDRLPSSRIFATQLVLLLSSGAVALLTWTTDVPTTWQLLTVGLATIVLVTAAVGVMPWDRSWAPIALLLVPLADLIAITLLRSASPSGGFGFLLLLPAAWLAVAAGRRAAAVGAGVGVVGTWIPTVLAELDLPPTEVTAPTIGANASLTIALVVVTGVLASTSARDAAQRRMLHRQARQSEDSYRQARRDEGVLNAVMDAVPFGVVSIDVTGQVQGSNRAARAILRHLGVPIATALTDLPVYHLDGVSPVAAEDMPQVRGLAGQPIDAEVYWVGHRGDARMAVEVSARLVLDEHRAVDRLVLVFRDVGDSIEAEAARDQAVSSISHEFRTPLSSILGFIELAADTDGLPAEAADHLEVAERNTTRLLTLVNDLLAARGSAPRSGVPITLGQIDLARIVRDAVAAMRPIANDRLVSIHLDSGRELGLLGDGFRVRQVVDNLISNAVKYNVDGGMVQVDLVADETSATLTVVDTGPGLSERERVEVFEPYRRARSAADSTVQGTGLGLSICRDIVEQHGGSIHLEEADTGGTAAIVHLPLAGVAPT